MENDKPQILYVKPDFTSFATMGLAIGLSGGVVWGLFTAANILTDGEIRNPWLWAIAALIGGPLANALIVTLCAAMGYPLFRYWAKKGPGLRLRVSQVRIEPDEA